MTIDTSTLLDVFDRLGQALAKPATLCLIGSTPAIATGQADRQTADLDVWLPGSTFDAGDLRRACRALGILYDPREELPAGAIYMQIIRPGIVRLPERFEREEIGRFDELTLVMPVPQLIVAAKLVRATPVDIEDVVWWMRHRRLGEDVVASAIASLPDAGDRETAAENLPLVRLVSGGDGT